MIDFRYHLVSIIAVFLALAVGIVVGTTALNGPVLDGLKTSVSSLTGDKRNLEGHVRDLRTQTTRDDEFVQLMEPVLLRGALAGQRVLLLSTPDAPSGLRDDLQKAVVAGGATMAGDVRIRSGLLDPTATATVDDVVAAVVPGALVLPNGSAADKAATELSAALVKSGAAVSPAAAQRILGGFTGADLLDVSGPVPDGSATLVLVVSGAAPAKPAADQKDRDQALLALLRAFDTRAGVLVAGPVGSAEAGGAVGALRASSLEGRVSSVDDADTPQGRVAAVLGLAEQAEGGAGSYGTGRGASATAPVPAVPR